MACGVIAKATGQRWIKFFLESFSSRFGKKNQWRIFRFFNLIFVRTFLGVAAASPIMPQKSPHEFCKEKPDLTNFWSRTFFFITRIPAQKFFYQNFCPNIFFPLEFLVQQFFPTRIFCCKIFYRNFCWKIFYLNFLFKKFLSEFFVQKFFTRIFCSTMFYRNFCSKIFYPNFLFKKILPQFFVQKFFTRIFAPFAQAMHQSYWRRCAKSRKIPARNKFWPKN